MPPKEKQQPDHKPDHKEINTPGIEIVRAAYEEKLVPAIEPSDVIRNPGGVLFTTDGLNAVGINPGEIGGDQTVKIGNFSTNGEIFKLIIRYYDYLVNNGEYKLACMDPRVAGITKLDSSCTHKECGAAGLVAKNLFINGEQVEVATSGLDVENILVSNLRVPKAEIFELAQGGHQDTGVILVFNGSVAVDDEVQQNMLNEHMGGAYVLTFDLPSIQKFLDDQGDLDDEIKKMFVQNLVRANLGIALDIALGDHNRIDIHQSGFNVVYANKPDSTQNILTQEQQRVYDWLTEEITYLIQEKLTEGGVIVSNHFAAVEQTRS